jgi:hypothetical protein
MNRRRWTLYALFFLVTAPVLVFSVFEYFNVRRRESIDHITSEIRASLPPGSTLVEVQHYLESNGIPYSRLIVSQRDSEVSDIFAANRVAAGTEVVVGTILQDATFVWLGAREVKIVFVFDTRSRLERFYAVAGDVP